MREIIDQFKVLLLVLTSLCLFLIFPAPVFLSLLNSLMASFSLLPFFLLLFSATVRSQSSFIFHGFNSSDLDLDQAATVESPGGVLRLTNRSLHIIGRAFYPNSIEMLNLSSSSSPNASSFSSSFVFAIVPMTGKNRGGFGFAFALASAPRFPDAESGHYLGLFNSNNNRDPENDVIAVEFDTVNGANEGSDSEGNHVGININNATSIASDSAEYHVDNSSNKENVILESGNLIRAWIDYDGAGKVVNITIAPLNIAKPSNPLITYSIDLTPYVKERMYVGFSASTGNKSSYHYILGWSFAVNGPAPPLNLTQLPELPEDDEGPPPFRFRIKLLLGVLSGAIVVGTLFVFWMYRRKKAEEELEEWELDCPRRFRYMDLYAATKGFKDGEVVGVGGFGAVYRGVLRSTGSEIAVKKIRRNSIQGLREFAAEIESLGRLRHKNLVNLQGWCKKKNDLLIVYDYIPNGSLDFLLYKLKDDFVLSWEQRFNIIKDIAAGLLYLHEEWEKVVIHRDVKPGNVLIDADMSARLSDFGLARLYDHDQISHTTAVVGTVGYLAPELARTGKASKSTDVFAFGVLLLEMASGRRPLGADEFILVDWVIECYQLNLFLDAADERLNSLYVVHEMELVLQLGLLCSHQSPELRPTMRNVVRYLNGDDPLPSIDGWINSANVSDSKSPPCEVKSNHLTTTSYRSSSIGAISSSSLNAGR